MRKSQLRLSDICLSKENTTSSSKTTSNIINAKSSKSLKPWHHTPPYRLQNTDDKREKPWIITGQAVATRARQHGVSSIGITLVFVLLSICAFTPLVVHAANVTLTWSANDPNPDGYNLYARVEGEKYDFDNPTWTGSAESIVMKDLEDGVTYYFIIRYLIGGVESSNSNELSYTTHSLLGSSTSNRVVVDNDDANAFATGHWRISAGKDPYADGSYYSLHPGATFTYASQISGSVEVALWWSYFGTRCNSVPVKIYDGNTLLDTVFVNQRKNSGQWYVLGSYNFSEKARVEVVARNNRCSTCADAVEFSRD